MSEPMKFFTLLASAVRTESAVGTAVTGFGRYQTATVVAYVTAESGTVTLDVYVQGSYDGGTTWVDIAASPQITGTGTYVIPIGNQGAGSAPFAATDATQTAASTKTLVLPDQIRTKTVSSGTTSFTFSVSGVAK